MTKLKAIIFASLFIGASACSAPPQSRVETMTQDTDKDHAAILSNGERWIALYQAGEIEKMRDLYEADAWVMPHGAPQLRGVDEVIDYFARNRKSDNQMTFRSNPEDLVIEGDRAYLVTQFAMRIKSPNGQTSDFTGRTFLVYRKGVDGNWRVWRDMDNGAPDVKIEIGNP